MKKSITVDFFRVSIPSDPKGNLHTVLQAASLAPFAVRNIERDGDYIRLQGATHSAGKWVGEMIKIRMAQLPLKASLDGGLSPIDLEKNQGLGEGSAFLYHVPTRILVLQRNRNAVTASTFAYYFSVKNGGVQAELDPVLEEEGVRQLDRLTTIRTFEVRLAPLDHLSMLKKQAGGSVSGMLSSSLYFQAPRVQMTLSMGRQRGSLQNTVETAKRLLRVSQTKDSPVEKVILTGQTDNEERTILDLLEYRMTEKIPIDSSRWTDFSVRGAAVQKAWSKRQDEILRMYDAATS